VESEKSEAINRLQVLETWFKEKEEELKKAVDRYEAERNIRGKDKDELVDMLEAKVDMLNAKDQEIGQLKDQLEEFRDEYEVTKDQLKDEIKQLERKSHESWLSLCQAERKTQEANKEAALLRQKLTSVLKEKDEVNGEMPYHLLTADMVPEPLALPDFFENFEPPPPLPLHAEPHRPAPLGRGSPPFSDNGFPLSPVRHGGERDYRDRDYRDRNDDWEHSDDNSSESDSSRRLPPRGRRSHDRQYPHPRTSSPVPGANL